MKVLIDACVLVPTLTRVLVLEVARAGDFRPLWSEAILAEWRYAAARSGALEAMATSGEIAVLSARFPDAAVSVDQDAVAALHLPDPQDRHVLAAALAGGADEILTFNSKDFPSRVLASHGVIRRHPDEFLLEALERDPARFDAILAEAASAMAKPRRTLLKAAQLPRLGKALDRGD